MLILAPATGFGARQLFECSARPLAAAAVAGLTAHLLAQQMDGPWAALLVGGLGGAAIYVALVASWSRRVIVAWRRVWEIGKAEDPASQRLAFIPAQKGARA
jgi:hypothetical protein